jgi:putative inorganic carbon (hco3(-)) transporter
VQDRSMDRLIAVLKIQLMTFVAFMAIRNRKHIEAFVWVIVISIGFYGFKGGIFTIATGGSGRVWGPPDSYLNGNNEIGLALTMVIPLANYLRQVSTSRWVRRGLLLSMLLCAAAVRSWRSPR